MLVIRKYQVLYIKYDVCIKLPKSDTCPCLAGRTLPTSDCRTWKVLLTGQSLLHRPERNGERIIRLIRRFSFHLYPGRHGF